MQNTAKNSTQNEAAGARLYIYGNRFIELEFNNPNPNAEEIFGCLTNAVPLILRALKKPGCNVTRASVKYLFEKHKKQAESAEGAEFCKECSAPVEKANECELCIFFANDERKPQLTSQSASDHYQTTCNNCKNNNKGVLPPRFCGNCGHKLQNTDSPEDSRPATLRNTRAKNSHEENESNPDQTTNPSPVKNPSRTNRVGWFGDKLSGMKNWFRGLRQRSSSGHEISASDSQTLTHPQSPQTERQGGVSTRIVERTRRRFARIFSRGSSFFAKPSRNPEKNEKIQRKWYKRFKKPTEAGASKNTERRDSMPYFSKSSMNKRTRKRFGRLDNLLSWRMLCVLFPLVLVLGFLGLNYYYSKSWEESNAKLAGRLKSLMLENKTTLTAVKEQGGTEPIASVSFINQPTTYQFNDVEPDEILMDAAIATEDPEFRTRESPYRWLRVYWSILRGRGGSTVPIQVSDMLLTKGETNNSTFVGNILRFLRLKTLGGKYEKYQRKRREMELSELLYAKYDRSIIRKSYFYNVPVGSNLYGVPAILKFGYNVDLSEEKYSDYKTLSDDDRQAVLNQLVTVGQMFNAPSKYYNWGIQDQIWNKERIKAIQEKLGPPRHWIVQYFSPRMFSDKPELFADQAVFSKKNLEKLGNLNFVKPNQDHREALVLVENQSEVNKTHTLVQIFGPAATIYRTDTINNAVRSRCSNASDFNGCKEGAQKDLQTSFSGSIVTTTVRSKLQKEATKAANSLADNVTEQLKKLTLLPDGVEIHGVVSVASITGIEAYAVSNFDPGNNADAGNVHEPGSTIKPYILATALRNGWKLTDTIWDGPYKSGHSPKNFNGTWSNQYKTLKQALAESCNMCFHRLIQSVKSPRIQAEGLTSQQKAESLAEVVEDLCKVGLCKRAKPRPDANLALGSGIEVRLDELVMAYRVFVTPSQDRASVLYKGNGLNGNSGNTPVFPAMVAADVISALAGVVENGTAKRATQAYKGRLGAKTGSSRRALTVVMLNGEYVISMKVYWQYPNGLMEAYGRERQYNRNAVDNLLGTNTRQALDNQRQLNIEAETKRAQGFKPGSPEAKLEAWFTNRFPNVQMTAGEKVRKLDAFLRNARIASGPYLVTPAAEFTRTITQDPSFNFVKDFRILISQEETEEPEN